MAIDDEKWIRLVAKLIADTQDRRVRWKLFTPLPEDPSAGIAALLAAQDSVGGRISATYLALVDDRAFRLDAYEGMGLLSFGSSYRLSIAKPDGKILRKVPVTSGLTDLMRAIDDQLAQVDEFVENYLGR